MTLDELIRLLQEMKEEPAKWHLKMAREDVGKLEVKVATVADSWQVGDPMDALPVLPGMGVNIGHYLDHKNQCEQPMVFILGKKPPRKT